MPVGCWLGEGSQHACNSCQRDCNCGALQDLVLDNVELKVLQREEEDSHHGDLEMPVRAGLEVNSRG